MIIRLKRTPDGGYSYADGRFTVERHATTWSLRDTTGAESLRVPATRTYVSRLAVSRLDKARAAIGEALEREDAAKRPTVAPTVTATVAGGRL